MNILRELRHAARRLIRRPTLSLLAISLLAVGLGGNLALLAVLDAILFRQPPVVEPERLVRVGSTDARGTYFDNWSYPNADDLRRGSTTLADAAIYADWQRFHLKIEGSDGILIQGSVVTGNYFTLLGARPAVGRLLAPGDDRADGPSPVAVLAHDFWRARFGSDPGVVGTEIGINGYPFRVIGVAPEGLASLDPTLLPQIWVPISAWPTWLVGEGARDALTDRGSSWLDVLARLAPGATVQAAQAELDARLAALAGEFPHLLMVENAEGSQPPRAWVMSISEARVGGSHEAPRVTRQATLVAAIGALVLIVIAANLAALLAARAGQLRHETAVCAALGASKVRLAQPLVLEGVVLTAVGALLAVPVAAAAVRLARRSLGFVLPLADDPALQLLASPRLLLVSGALLALIVLLVGALPGLVASRFALLPALRREEITRPGSRVAAPDLLVGVQTALSVILLLVAAALVGRFRELAAVDPGFAPEGVVQASYNLGLQGYERERTAHFHAELLRRAQVAIGDRQVALTDWTPLSGGWSRTTISPDGYEGSPGEAPNGDVSWVSPELFRVLGIRLERGRLFHADDTVQTPGVAVINATMARRYFAGRDPLGATFRIGSRSPELAAITVVGVVADARYRDLRSEVPPMFFRPLAQRAAPPSRLVLVARAEPPAAALAALRGVLRDLDPELPLYRTGRLVEQVAGSIDDERRAAALFASFAALVLVLAAAGLGALALATVTRRRREIGVRMALGASARSVVGLLVRRTAWIVGGGCAAGLALAVPLLPRLGEIAGAAVTVRPALLAAALAVLGGAAVIATWLPARRALRIDPADVLRSE